MRKEILEKIEALQKIEDTRDLSRKLKDLKEDYYNVARIEAEQQLQKFLDEGGNRADYERPKDEVDFQFKEVVTKLGDRIASFRERLRQEELKNFDKKNNLLSQIEGLKEEEHIGKALAKMKAIQEVWKAIGNVPKEKAKALSSEYSHKLDDFYYGIKIYSELQDHDFKKNIELRIEVIDKIRKLGELKSIKEIQTLLPAYQADWDQQGPVFKTEWEKLRDEYWTELRKVQEKVKGHFTELRDKQGENLNAKKELIAKIDHILANHSKNQKPSQWDKLTKEIIELQNKWKNIGFAGKKDNDQIWKSFTKKCDEFFKAKSEFFKVLKGELKGVKAKKLKLIEEITALKGNTNWRDTSLKIQKLQKRWKDTGSLMHGEEQKMWNQFRSECDYFFNKKKEWYAGLDERKANNLKEKKSFLSKLAKLKIESSGDEAKVELANQFKKFYDIGPVPEKNGAELMKEFQDVQQNLLKSLGLEQEDIKALQYKVKLERISGGENPEESLQKEIKDIERAVKNLDSDKIQYENNLGFFQHGADDNPMKKEVIDKIKALESRRSGMIDRIKLIKAELRNLKQRENS